MAARSAALKLDWANVTRSLGLKGQTATSLAAFKARSDEARRKVQQLSELPTTVDFAKYRASLKNQAVVDEVERRFREHRPAAYDVTRQLKAIDAFEVEAMKNAEATKKSVDVELSGLQKTLVLMQNARPFEDMTVDELAEAVPWIDEQTEKRVSQGLWDAPGYKEKFGDLSVL